MKVIDTALLATALVCVQGCPSAYQRAYDADTQRLEENQRAANAQATAEHAEASRYAAVVYFPVGSAVMGADGQRELRWFVEKMQSYPQAVILVQGFADTTGAEATNQGLSQNRAQAVTTYLISQGIPEARISKQGFGTESPAASNLTAKGRRNNRRVEVTVQ